MKKEGRFFSIHPLPKKNCAKTALTSLVVFRNFQAGKFKSALFGNLARIQNVDMEIKSGLDFLRYVGKLA